MGPRHSGQDGLSRLMTMWMQRLHEWMPTQAYAGGRSDVCQGGKTWCCRSGAKLPCSSHASTRNCSKHLPSCPLSLAEDVLAQRDARLSHVVQAHRALVVQPRLLEGAGCSRWWCRVWVHHPPAAVVPLSLHCSLPPMHAEDSSKQAGRPTVATIPADSARQPLTLSSSTSCAATSGVSCAGASCWARKEGSSPGARSGWQQICMCGQGRR